MYCIIDTRHNNAIIDTYRTLTAAAAALATFPASWGWTLGTPISDYTGRPL